MVNSTPGIRQLNLEKIRKEVQNNETYSKAEISRATGLSMATCNTLLNKMVEDNEIVLEEKVNSSVGRPVGRYSYNPDYLHVAILSLDNEGHQNTVMFGIADALGNLRSLQMLHPEEITYSVLEELIEKDIVEDPLIQYMMVGIPGTSHKGVIDTCDVETMIGIDIETQLREKFGFPVEVRNDMDFITRGAYQKQLDHEGTFACVYFPVSDGYVGTGMIINEKVLTGTTKFVGELSYIAESFGISREEQRRILWHGTRKEFRDFAAKVAMILIGTIDPEVIVLTGKEMDQEDLEQIRAVCTEIVTDAHVPKFVADNDLYGNYQRGMVAGALQRSLFPIS